MTTPAEDLQAIVPYCERLATGAESINTISNAGFVLAALYGWYLWKGNSNSPVNQKNKPAVMLLLLLCLLIGSGSTLFHAIPSHLTHLLDIVPVCLFALLALWLCLSRYHWPREKSVCVLGVFIAATALAAQWPQVLAHSLFYLPTLLVLAYLAIALKPQRERLALLTLIFASALTFRALDLPLCDLAQSQQTFPALAGTAGQTGTHFLWHVLTALACVLCLQLVIAPVAKKTSDSNTQL